MTFRDTWNMEQWRVKQTGSGRDTEQRSLGIRRGALENDEERVGPWGPRQEECLWELTEPSCKGQRLGGGEVGRARTALTLVERSGHKVERKKEIQHLFGPGSLRAKSRSRFHQKTGSSHIHPTPQSCPMTHGCSNPQFEKLFCQCKHTPPPPIVCPRFQPPFKVAYPETPTALAPHLAGLLPQKAKRSCCQK